MSNTSHAADISTGNQKEIDHHKTAAKHHEEAAKHLHEATKYLKDGNNEKACASTLKAHGHSCLANEEHKEVVKQHASKNNS